MRPTYRLVRLPLAAALLVTFPSWAADGQESPALKVIMDLRGAGKKKTEGPRRIEAERIEGVVDERSSASGAVTLRQEGLTVRADRVDYEDASDTATATGNVVLDRDGDIAKGDRLLLELGTKTGTIDSPSFYFPKNINRRQDAWASAKRADLEGNDKERFFNAEYTTCKPGDEEWYLRMSELGLDHTRAHLCRGSG